MMANVVAYCAQVAVIIGCGALLPWIARIDAPAVRYAYWRMLAALCLALPWLQAARPAPPPAVSTVAAPAVVAVMSAARALPPPADVNWTAIAAAVIVAGIVLRLGWVAAGLVTLRRLRADCAACPPCDDHADLQTILGTRASIHYVPSLAQPMTFGVRRPVVLLPESLRDHAPDIQRAVLAHELLHVQRRDWAWLLVEEGARAVCWFHPAAWWLISRVQLAREEVVDELAVMVTGRRRTYVEALLAFADYTPLVPTAAFARRRHLFRRMMSVSREVAMPAKRIVLSCAMMALVVATGSRYAVSAFPLQEPADQSSILKNKPGPLELRAKPITPENPVPRRVNMAMAPYPAEAAAINASGVVTVRITLDELGRVAETRATHVDIKTDKQTLTFSSSDRNMRAFITNASGADEAAAVMNAIAGMVRSVDDSVRQWRYDPPADGPISFPVTISFAGQRRGADAASGDDAVWTPGVVRVGGGIKQPKKVRDVKPVYPPEAMRNRIEGVVIVEARVEPDGHVSQARVLRSIPMLDEAATDAVKQWLFTPTLLNGNPIPVVMTLTVNFTLQ